MRFFSFFLLGSFIVACAGNAEDSSVIQPPAPTVAEKPPEKQRPPPDENGPPTWCDSNGSHDFCADFDGADAFAEWDDALRGTDRNQKDIDELTPSERSSPNALRISGDDITTERQSDTFYPWSGMFLTKKLPTTSSPTATISFDLYVASTQGVAGVVSFSGRTRTDDYAFHVSFDVGKEATWLAAALGEIPKMPPIERGKWVRVAISIDDNGGTGGIAALAFDGVNAGTATFEGSLASSVETTLYLGVSRNAPSQAYDVRYDNVVVDLH